MIIFSLTILNNLKIKSKGLLGGLPPPQVEVFCIHGSEVLIHLDDDENHGENHDGVDENNDNINILTIVIEVMMII